MSSNLQTVFSAKRISKTRWEYEFHPDSTEAERVEYVFRFRRRGWDAFRTQENNRGRSIGQDYSTWDETIEAGKSYMVGNDVPTADFLKSHGSYIPADNWLAYAVEYCFNNPTRMIVAQTHSNDYEIYKDGEYVCIALPHHGRGGENHWIVHPSNPRKKIHVNRD